MDPFMTPCLRRNAIIAKRAMRPLLKRGYPCKSQVLEIFGGEKFAWNGHAFSAVDVYSNSKVAQR
jgi:hypothetical protein